MGQPRTSTGWAPLKPCRLCGDLAQLTIHFDVGYWAALKESAEARLAEARADVTEADRHLRMLGKVT